eukprot:CAMPEP_0176131546 /NCGR_PEP_ID=MMETSP0120_2-20121206/66597_1 /TAXON_ID=160619 /ORGANISM="Kryptoperidinium foliaceum, Strain CCMP 1326" /LENGTH=160 /DNA_ID=CAMNT_0017466927 /DNA_START=1 /DNA_END=479 /DNA_ORIENTATION=-
MTAWSWGGSQAPVASSGSTPDEQHAPSWCMTWPPCHGAGVAAASVDEARNGSAPPLFAEYPLAGIQASNGDLAFALTLLCWGSAREAQDDGSSSPLGETLSEAFSWLTGPGSCAGHGSNRLVEVRRAIEDAEAAGAQEELLDTMRARLEELELEVRRELA